ncbi:PHB depolymerase family esterase [soil metagenome]
MPSSSRRTLALSGAAASVVAVVVGLLACGGSDEPSGDTVAAADGAADVLVSPPDPAADGDVPKPACGPAGVKPGFVAQNSVTFGATKGTYSLYVADNYDGKTAFPVIFAFHGDGGDGESMRGAKLEQAAAGGAIIVYPDGPNQTWDLETPPAQNRDYAFFDAIVADLKTKLCVDEKRVFAFGFSRGAFFSNQLGCFRGDVLRGVAANSGGGPYSNDGNDFDQNGFFKCPKPAVAALIIHGESDGDVPYSAGVKSRDHWRLRNACGTATKAYAPSPCVTYDGCPAGHAVAWCSIPSMGHQIWSSTAQAAWSFFSAQ